MVLCRTFHNAPEKGWARQLCVHHCSGSGPGLGTGHRQCDYTMMVEMTCMKVHAVSLLRDVCIGIPL